MPRYTIFGQPNPEPYFEPEDAEALIDWELDTESMFTHILSQSAHEAEAAFDDRTAGR